MEKYDVNQVIAPEISAMNKPKMWKGVGDLNILIFTPHKEAQEHVKQGFALVHASWDVEAYRHFAAALQKDPDCLMAYCGIVMSLINPEHEWKQYRQAAIERMLDLAAYKIGEGEDAEYMYPSVERGYASAIGHLVTDGLGKGSKAFGLLAEKFPQDIQLKLLKAFLSRGRYDAFGNADTRQSTSVDEVKKILAENPDNPLALNFYVMMLIEAPYNAVDLKKDVMPHIEKLLKLSDGKIPTWHTLNGFANWRIGNLEKAKAAYEQAIAQYEEWMKDSNATIADADGMMRALSFLAVIHYELGDMESHNAVLKKLAKAKDGRKTSSVYALYAWDYELIEMKLLLAKGDLASVKKALEVMPKVTDRKNKDKVHYNHVLTGYMSYAQALERILSGKRAEAQVPAQRLMQIVAKLKEMRKETIAKPYYGHYLLSLNALSVLQYELSGIALGKDATAFDMYKEAINRQLSESKLFTPVILYPIEHRLGLYYEKKGDFKSAREEYQKAVNRRPSHQASQKALEKLKKLIE